MIYKNAELYNVEQIIQNEDGSISWCRVPEKVLNSLESETGSAVAHGSTGVELRFRIKSGKAVIKMSVSSGEGCFHVYHGAIQGGWQDHEVHKTVRENIEEFVIEPPENPEALRKMTAACGSEWDCEVVRVIFDRGGFKIFDISGDIEPPKKEQCPSKTLFCYGSSITHGSNSIDMSHSWASVLAHNLNYDVKNKGMAGTCFMEPEYIKYIAAEGKNNRWDALILELGINVLSWSEEKIYERVINAVTTTAEANPEKPIFVISPFYHLGETLDCNDRTGIWRRIIEEVVSKCGYSNVTYINGADILGDMTLISADLVHPNIYGAAQIAERLTKIIKPITVKGS